jgi:hypothetical protein
VSVARRIPTNTPLQALVTLNDPVYSEAARALAKRVLAIPAARLPRARGHAADENASEEIAARLNYAGRLVLSRDLTPEELADVRAYHDSERRRGSSPQAMRAVASLLLNLDAAMNR